MDKEELIKLIESIDFKKVKSFKLNYLKEESSRFNFDNNPIESLCYGEDFVESVQHEMQHLHQRIDRFGEDVFRLVNKEEK
jgi:hypothetical protein